MFLTLSNHIFDFILKEKEPPIVFCKYFKIQYCKGTDSLIGNFPKLRPKICCIKTSTLELTSFGLNFSKELNSSKLAFKWLIDNQNSDGSWFSKYEDEKPIEKNNDIKYVEEKLKYAWENRDKISKNARNWYLNNYSFLQWKKKMYSLIK